MDNQVLVIIIIAVTLIVLFILLLYRRRLTRLGVKASNQGVEIEADMSDQSKAGADSAKKSTSDVKRISQEGDRDEISIKAKKVKARNIKQKGDDNKINIG